MATLSAGRGWLNDDAAASLHRMDAAYGSPIPLTDAGRTNAEQWALWNRWQAGGTYNRPPYLYQPAYPGQSPHEAGNAIDIGNNDARNWVINNGGRFGWRRNISSDVVHFIYEAWNDAGGSGIPGGSTPGTAAGALINIGGPNVARLQEQLGVEADGIPGPITVTALQARVGAIQDGEWGPDTLSRTQAFVGATVDGIWGPESHTLIVAAIDAGKFRTSAGGGDPDVLEAQQLLNKLGYGLVEDGVKGPLTKTAIEQFQASAGLTVDGVFGPLTKAAALAKIANPGGPVTPPPTEYPAGYYRPSGLPAGTLFGIDVSRWQAGFDFAAYKAGAKEDFAILKRGGSNAGTYIDSQYATLLPAARGAGLKIGHYWFNGRDDVSSPTESALAFLRDLDIKPGEIVALDVETELDRNGNVTTAAYSAAEALEWLHVVEAALGIKPLVYMSASVARQQQWAAVKAEGYPLWVAMYSWLSTSPEVGTYVPNDIDPLNAWGDGNAWVIHQYTSTVYGSMPGTASKSLDRNIAKPDTFARFGFVAYPPAGGVNLDEARALAARIQTDAADLAAVLTPADS